MLKKDYIEQMIEQLAGALARIAGLTRETKYEQAEQELDATWSSIGLRRTDASRLDDGTVRALLGAKLPLAVKLLEAEATLEEARGNATLAEGLRRRAVKLS